jgi:hypothetical protein
VSAYEHGRRIRWNVFEIDAVDQERDLAILAAVTRLVHKHGKGADPRLLDCRPLVPFGTNGSETAWELWSIRRWGDL